MKQISGKYVRQILNNPSTSQQLFSSQHKAIVHPELRKVTIDHGTPSVLNQSLATRGAICWLYGAMLHTGREMMCNHCNRRTMSTPIAIIAQEI